MQTNFKRAQLGDVEVLIELMQEYYPLDHLRFDEPAARAAVRRILGDQTLGRIWLIQQDDYPIGYVVLTLGFSLEFHGRDAFVDELYVREAYRGRGIGMQALRFVEDACGDLDVQALHLEVERANTSAQGLYRKVGFVDHDRYLMTKRTAR